MIIILNLGLISDFPKNIIETLETFSSEVKKHISIFDNILIVSMDEDSSFFSEYLTYSIATDERLDSTIAYYLQGTKLKFNTDWKIKMINGNTLHSNSELPFYDTVIFIKDEILNGNDILGLLDKLKKINPNCSFIAASIINLQKQKDIKAFDENGIKRIFISENDNRQTHIASDNLLLENINKTKIEVKDISGFSYKNHRLGVDGWYSRENLENLIMNIIHQISDFVVGSDEVLIIGTEGFSFVPLKVAEKVESVYNIDTRYQRTITARDKDNISEVLIIPSLYKRNSKCFLFNPDRLSKKIIVITDSEKPQKSANIMASHLLKSGAEIMFVRVPSSSVKKI